MDEKNYSKPIFYLLLAFSLVTMLLLCKYLSSVLLPAVVAVLLGLSLSPIIQKITRKTKLPWVLTSIFLIIAMLIVVSLLSSLLLSSLNTIVNEYPKYEKRFQSIYKVLADNFGLAFDEQKNIFENMWSSLNIRQYIQKIAIYLSSGFINAGKNIFMTVLLLAFFLVEMRLTEKKIRIIFVKHHIKSMSTQIVFEVSRYISIKFFISLATGVIVFLSTWAIGLSFPIIWGFLAFIMNFIPTFGSIISTAITTIFALLQFYPSWGRVIFVLIIMILVNFLLGNILEPRIEGKHLGLSPFVILICLTLWGWAWGFIGMILAVPMTVIIKIICENVSYLNKFAILLGNDATYNNTAKKTEDSEKEKK